MGEHEAPSNGIDPKVRFYAYCASFGILVALGAAGIIDGDYINAINFVIAGVCGVAAFNVPGITKEK
jgi:hypothetical protein